METDPLSSLGHAAWALWAKSGDDHGWISLPQHMNDAATVARALWDAWASPQIRRALTSSTGLEEDEVGVLYEWLACVHDVGKASRQFAGQLDSTPLGSVFADRIRDRDLPMTIGAREASVRIPHGAASRELVRSWLIENEGMPLRTATKLAAIVDAHHGMPSSGAVRNDASVVLGQYEPVWQSVWRDLFEHAAWLTGVRPVLQRIALERLKVPVEAQMLLTGLVIMADWIASNADAFPMMQEAALVDQAHRTAFGLERIDLTAPWVPQVAGNVDALMRDRFEWPDHARPRPVQSAIAEVCAVLNGPALIIVEAPTGEGKTEAALVAAELRADAEGSGGVFFGAPTMATSDALFRRIQAWAQRAVPQGDVASMFLGHSRAALNEEFRSMRFVGVDRDGDRTENVVASQWLSGRKKGLLSNLVVGTVDQLLVMALQTKHSMLRHVALAGKVIVIDEVHAYDTYMNAYLGTALRWLSSYGVTVVLLSATLPVGAKRRLIEAYAPEDCRVPDELSTSYPLVTTVTRGGVGERVVESRPPDAHVRVQFIPDGVAEVVDQLTQQTIEGGCVLVLCNSVIRAQQVLEGLGPDLREDAVLLHARFVAADRLERERALTDELGPRSHRGSGRPHRRIIVATQVAEQSLDVDVDLLITDIAPMDLVLQRMGRLHRHARPQDDRPPSLREPKMLVRGVREIAPVPVFDAHASGIYGDRLLLSTLHLLVQRSVPSGIVRPDDVPDLVQAAYDDHLEVPATWSEAWAKAGSVRDQADGRALGRSTSFRIPVPDRALEIADLFKQQQVDVSKNRLAEQAGFAQVRDTDASIEVVLIVDDPDGGYRPLPWLAAGDVETLLDETQPSRVVADRLARSAVRLPRRIATYQFDDAIAALERQTPLGWRTNALLRGMVALRLDDSLAATLCGMRLSYDREFGLSEVRA